MYTNSVTSHPLNPKTEIVIMQHTTITKSNHHCHHILDGMQDFVFCFFWCFRYVIGMEDSDNS